MEACGWDSALFLPHQLEDDAEMAAKHERVCHVNDAEFVVDVYLAQRVQHLHFNERLVMKTAHVILLLIIIVINIVVIINHYLSDASNAHLRNCKSREKPV